MNSQNTCVLMFSGGRDSTLAALRLAKTFSKLILVTVTSEHLIGIGAVYKRLNELKSHLPVNTEWFHIVQPTNLKTDISFYAPTCLPCHHAYVAVGLLVAEKIKARHVAFGYAGYQSMWPEQTKHATERLKKILSEYNIELVLPVYEVQSLDELNSELLKRGINPISLEQKCNKQVTNIELEHNLLLKEILRWEKSIMLTLKKRKSLKIEIIKQTLLQKFDLNS